MVTVQSVLLKRDNWHGNACLGISRVSMESLLQSKEAYLHQQELAFFEELDNVKKQYNFLSGRYVAKQVLAQYLNTCSLNSMLISKGVFSQPLVVAATVNPPAISIAHTNGVAACLVFPREHPMGLDAETLKEQNIEAVKSQMTLHEKKLSGHLNEDTKLFHTRIWTAKEALSKVLTTGLMAPMEFYQIERIAYLEEHTLCDFSYFAQYKAISFRQMNTIFSIVLPKNTQFRCNFQALTQLRL